MDSSHRCVQIHVHELSREDVNQLPIHIAVLVNDRCGYHVIRIEQKYEVKGKGKRGLQTFFTIPISAKELPYARSIF